MEEGQPKLKSALRIESNSQSRGHARLEYADLTTNSGDLENIGAPWNDGKR